MTALADLTDEQLADAIAAALLDADDVEFEEIARKARAVFTGDIRALTLKAPWGALIASGQKTVENRVWELKYRGLVAIHTGQGVDRAAMKLALDEQGDGFIRRAYRRIASRLTRPSHIVAVARIDDCHPYEPGCCVSPWAEKHEGIWHWTLTGVRALPEPIPAKGRLGLWRPSPDLVAQVLAQLAVPNV